MPKPRSNSANCKCETSQKGHTEEQRQQSETEACRNQLNCLELCRGPILRTASEINMYWGGPESRGSNEGGRTEPRGGWQHCSKVLVPSSPHRRLQSGEAPQPSNDTPGY